ncbi:allophanate hydrolase [Bordetella holmesii]|uniref:5-oxoprolinase subunit PxpB n=1 Tax=Bordetella holmesii TaxID=35814 RepID=UPI0002BC07F6|nr:5-oxoprolinase subunit PxpB [Bordetella holmesii]AHV93344.1 allophanate hydrolase subunit 1 family protein [Bordetella holmesii ATCC 51541]AMD49056.1 allophanate hydrolase [Bordetella holmesii F627]AUL18417.1 allophanate hydrolase [Bordetella holmesii]AUL21732.1 allophanate hydrolase [Bordetella holmesii]AUL25052.1 allophanate hydrolase [Bordetella holmesii]
MSETQEAPTGHPDWRIQPQGDRCLLVILGDTIAEATGRLCLGLARQIRLARWPGVVDVVPSFTTVAVHYRPVPQGGLRFAELADRVRELLAQDIVADTRVSREVDVPVCYGGKHGPDLAQAAQSCGLTEQELIALHGQAGSMVYMLGFAPGHSYIGVHDERLNLPRRDSPRTEVPAGSVAIANRQTVIYPNRLPGGWSIIGATPLVMFDPAREPASLLQPGDRIRFVPIDEVTFDRLRAEQP